MIVVNNLYPAAKSIDIGERLDNDPPVFEKISLYKVPQAYISSFGYIISNFNVLREGISYRHRNSVSFKNILSFLLRKKKIEVNASCLSIANGWFDSYYHFTLECLPKLFLLRKNIDTSVLIFPSKLSSFHKQWFNILNIQNIQLIDENEIVKTPLAITTTFTSRDLNHHDIIIPEFREWVLSKINTNFTTNYSKIFVGRKNPKFRILLNNPEVKTLLESYGFVYLEMEDLQVEEQIKVFNTASQIICVHGAALSNICFCKPGTKIIDLMHEDFKQWCFLKLAVVLNLNYHIQSCTGIKNNQQLPGHRDITVDVQKLEETIKKW